uniref:Gustatory receptor n=1 Tax=Timema bartmani TaxID=61472 RepID=A0A7R9F8A9_9NEOP|nr:unnamed protein product [Timema bartmani]
MEDLQFIKSDSCSSHDLTYEYVFENEFIFGGPRCFSLPNFTVTVFLIPNAIELSLDSIIDLENSVLGPYEGCVPPLTPPRLNHLLYYDTPLFDRQLLEMEALSNPRDLLTASRPLLYTSAVVGLAPDCDVTHLRTETSCVSRLKLAHTVLMTISVLSGFAGLITSRALYSYPYAIPTMSVTDVAVLSLAMATSVVSLLACATYNRASVSRVFTGFQEIDRTLLDDAPRVYRSTVATQVVQLCVVFSFLTLIFFYDNLLWYEGVLDRVVAVFAIYVVHTVNLVMVLQFVNLVTMLNHRTRRLNERLQSDEVFRDNPTAVKTVNGTSLDGNHVVFVQESVEINLSQASRLRVLRGVHDRLGDIARRINVAYGVQILFDVTASFVTLTTDVYFGVTFGEVISRSQQQGYGGTLDALLLSLCWIAMYVAKLTFVMGTCNASSALDKQTLILVQKMMLREDVQADVVAEAQMFAQQVYACRFKFSAWGFFSLSYSTLCGIAGAVTMYLVILLQFQQMTR